MAKTEARLTISAQDETRAAFESIKKRVNGMSKDFDAAKGSIGALNDTANLLRDTFGALTIGLGVGGLSALIKSSIDATAEAGRLAQTLGVSAGTLSEWQFAAQQTGLSAEKVGDIFKDTADKIGDFAATGGGEAADLFERLNLDINELINLSPDQQLLKIAEALDTVGNRAEKIFLLESLTDDASRLLPLLENNAEKFRELRKEAQRLGVTISEDQVRSAEAARQAIERLTGSWDALIRALVTGGTVDKAAAGIDMLAENLDTVVKAAGLVASVFAGRMLASLTAGIQAQLASVGASRAHSVALAEEAARTTQAAAAKLAYNNMLLAEAQAAVAAATGLQRLTLVQTTLIPAQNRAAAAAAAHTAALQAQAVAAAKASTAATVLRGALAFFGGPIGLAITGVAGAVYLLSTRTSESAEAANLAKNANEELNRILGDTKNLTKETAQAAIEKAGADLKQAEAALAAAKAEAEKRRAFAKQVSGSQGQLGSTADVIAFANEGKVEKIQEQVEALRASLGKANETIKTLGSAPGGDGQGGSNPALERLIKDLDKVGEATRQYQERLATLTNALKNNEITQAEFNRLSGLAKEELDRVIGSADGAGKAGGRLAGRIKSTIEQLRIQAATLGMNSVEVELYKLKLEGASQAQLNAARTALEAVEAHKAHEEQLKKSAQAADDAFERSQQLRERGLSIFKDLLPEEEQLKIQEAELVYLHDQGAFGEGQQAVETLNLALQKLREDFKGTGDTMSQFAIQAARNIQDSFADFLFDPFKEGMDGMLTGFTNMLRRMAAELAAQEVLKAIFGGLSGGATAGDGSFGGFMATIAASVNHDGGIVGGAGRRRNVPADAFIGAPRFHSGGILGLGPNERAAVLELGEEVLPRDHPRHALNGGGMPKVIVNIQAIDDRSLLERMGTIRQELAIGVAQAMRQYNLGSS